MKNATKSVEFIELWKSIKTRIRAEYTEDPKNPKTFNKDKYDNKLKQLSPIFKDLWRLGEPLRKLKVSQNKS